MNRILRNDGTWYKRNGLKGSGVAWYWNYLTSILPDTINLDSNLVQFEYTPDGVVPEGAYTDTINLDSNLVQFGYTPDGEVPVGAYNDDLNLDADMVSFSYTV